MKLLTIWLLILTGTANAADLDAPLNDRPTLGSEIERGWRAATDCNLKNIANALEYVDCIDGTASKAQQEHSNANPFLLGLYYGEAAHFGTDPKVDSENASSNSFAASEVATDRARLAPAYEVFRHYQKQLDVKDDQLVGTLSDLSDKGKADALAQLKNWEIIPPPSN